MKPKEANLKKNDAGDYLFWAYTYRNVHTGLYYVGVTVNRGNRKSIWKNIKNRYGGEKISQARKQYPDWEKDWEYTEVECTARTFEELLAQMDYTENYLITYYNSYYNGYNSNLGGGGSSSKSRILVIEKDGNQVIYNSCEDVARVYTMSPGNVYHYAYGTTEHRKRNGMIFLPIDDTATMTALPPTFLSTYSILIP